MVGISPPAISVVIPLYNKERDVARAIRSALAQTFTDYELIVVNDGSTDRSVDTVATFNDPRIRLVHQVNQGVSAARNRGITEARSELIAFLDADDEWFPDFLSSILYLKNKHTNCDIFATYYLTDKSNSIFYPTINCLPSGFREGILSNYFKIAAHSDPPLCSSAISANKQAIKTIGYFPLGVTSGEDLITWAKLAAKYNIAYLFEPKSIYFEQKLLSDSPSRRPVNPDYVGNELINLLNSCDTSMHLDISQYYAFWLKIRSVSYMFFDDNIAARKEIRKAIPYCQSSIFFNLMYILLCLPNNISIKVYNCLIYLKRLKHKIIVNSNKCFRQ